MNYCHIYDEDDDYCEPETCWDCDGEGFVVGCGDNDTCPTCHGEGEIQ